jgi:hypothetical protein
MLPCGVADPLQQYHPDCIEALPCSSHSVFAKTMHKYMLLASCCKHAAASFLVHAGEVTTAAAAAAQHYPCSPSKQHTYKRTPAHKVGSNHSQHMSSTSDLNECSKGLRMPKQ